MKVKKAFLHDTPPRSKLERILDKFSKKDLFAMSLLAFGIGTVIGTKKPTVFKV